MLPAGLPEVPGEGGGVWALRAPLTFYTDGSRGDHLAAPPQ